MKCPGQKIQLLWLALPLSPPLCLHPVILMDFWSLSLYILQINFPIPQTATFCHSLQWSLLTAPGCQASRSKVLTTPEKATIRSPELRQPLEVPTPPPSPEGQHLWGEKLVLKTTFCHFNSEFILRAHHKIRSPGAGLVCLCGVRAAVTSSSIKMHPIAGLGPKKVCLLVFYFYSVCTLHTWKALNKL